LLLAPLHHIEQSAPVTGYYANDIRRHRLRIYLLVQRLAELSTVNEPSERQSIKIDGPGQLGNNRGARLVSSSVAVHGRSSLERRATVWLGSARPVLDGLVTPLVPIWMSS
jgi:hypothetical protein